MVQVNNSPITLRVKFFKRGNLQYISHLDLVRTMMKVIVRAGLPLWYTEGFNPKPKVTFAAPLSIGTESVAEFMDVRLTERISCDEAMSCLNKNMAPDMQIIEAYYPESKLTELRWLGYDISVNSVYLSEELFEKCKSLFEESVLNVMKKGKRGESLVDIKPLIRNLELRYDGEELKIQCILSADSQSFLNPEYIIKLLRERIGLLASDNLLEEGYSIMRTSAYFDDMSEFS